MWSERIMKIDKRGERLAAFVIFLFVVAFGSVGAAGQYLWYENRPLFWVVIISVPLAFLLKRKLNSMEREMERLKTLEAEEYSKEYDKGLAGLKKNGEEMAKEETDSLVKAMSTEDLLAFKAKYHDNQSIQKIINGILDERGEATKES